MEFMVYMPPPTLLTVRPNFTIDGAVNVELTSRLLGLTIVSQIGGPCRCSARFTNFANGDYLYFSPSLLDFGKRLCVSVADQIVFEGKVFGLKAGFSGGVPDLTALAGDRLEDLAMVRRTRTFNDVSDADVVQRVASDYGLTAVVDLGGPVHQVLAQVNQTDLEFLDQRMRATNALYWVEDSVLHVSKARGQLSTAPTLVYGENLRQFEAAADARLQRTEIRVTGWDVASKTAISCYANASMVSGVVAGGSIGPDIVSDAFGQRSDTIVSTVPLSHAEAQQRADDAFMHMAHQFVIASGVADLDARLQVGAAVTVRGVGALFSGVYYLTEVRHVFDTEGGLRTQFTAKSVSLGRT